MSVEKKQLKHIIEGALLAYGQVLSIKQMQQLFPASDRPDSKTIQDTLGELQQDYTDRGIELKQVASGYRFQACKAISPWLANLWEEKPPRYSRALLETLVLIAYRQPITRAEIEEIRGVVVSTHIIRTLLERDWVRVVGQRDVPGKPSLYATTKQFLDYFNLKSLEDLPTLSEVRDIDTVEKQAVEQLNLVVADADGSDNIEQVAEYADVVDQAVIEKDVVESSIEGNNIENMVEQGTENIVSIEQETELFEQQASD